MGSGQLFFTWRKFLGLRNSMRLQKQMWQGEEQMSGQKEQHSSLKCLWSYRFGSVNSCHLLSA